MKDNDHDCDDLPPDENNWKETDCGYPPYPPYPPFPAFPPFPPFPQFPPYPASPPSYEPLPCPLPGIDGSIEQPCNYDGNESKHGDGSPGSEGGDIDHNGSHFPPSLSRISVRRPDDLLVFDLLFEGLIFKENPPRLERSSSNAYIIFEFPPQSFGEEAYYQVAEREKLEKLNIAPNEQIEVTSHPGYPPKNVAKGGADETPTTLPAARVRMAGRSRIAVNMPVEQNSIPYNLVSMLTALRDWPMRLDFNAVADAPQIPLWAQEFMGSPSFHSLQAHVADQLSKQSGAKVTLPTLTQAIFNAAQLSATSIGTIDPNVSLVPILPFFFGPHEPESSVTALELPYRLVLSPVDTARWRHSDIPFIRRGRTELWHTRLTTGKEATGPDQPSRIRALWSPDYRPKEKLDELINLISEQPQPADGPAPNPDLIRMSLDPVDRSMLVTLMAGFDATLDNGAAYRPLSSEAKRLHLSALGALLDAEGNWTALPEGIDLQQWQHLATLGRDHYVRVMYVGYLCPFGHSASLVKVTERKFQSLIPGKPERVAFLRQRFFIVVREPVRVYSGVKHKYEGRNFPFKRIEILTRVTPDLSEPGMGASALKPPTLYSDTPKLAPRMLFWPMVPANNTDKMIDVPFEIAGTDLCGNRVTFSMPLLFVGKLADDNQSKANAVKMAYNASFYTQKRRAYLGGSVVCYAPFDPSDKGDPRLPTESITFKAGDLTSAAKPKFYPEIEVASIGVKSVQKLLSQPDFLAEVAYPEFYNTDGFNATNAAKIFLQFTSAKLLAFGGAPNQAKSDALGALASPQMNLLGLSKVMGPVGGKDANGIEQVKDALKNVKAGTFDPKEFFSEAKILGGIAISDILTQKHDLAGADVPKMLARDFPDRVEASFDWATEVAQSDSFKLLIPRADPGKPQTRLSMSGVVRTPLDPTKPASFEATASLDNFKLNLFGIIILWFEKLTFSAKKGQKPDVNVELREGEDAVQFGGQLEFVNELRKFIPSNGFSDPPSLSVTPSGIAAAYSLTLPAIEIGIFAISNASLGAGFNLPFDSRPASVKFNFSERQHPFSLTVSLLGGGGFFLIGVSARGVNEIEAALEFGAAIAIDLGVASGGVEVKAGIYFHWLEPVPDKKGTIEVAGYVRIHGELSVLAIISVSLTFHLQLGYHNEGGKASVYGEATLVVEIEILIFSAEVSVRCRKEFAGGNADPKFIDLIPTQQIWADYCDAFAEETV
jgi:hypothetical protein